MKREDVVRLRSILGLLDEARMLVQAREPGAAGCFQRKFASQAADFMRDRGPALLALAEAVEGLTNDLHLMNEQGETPDGDGITVNVQLWAERWLGRLVAAPDGE